MKQGVGARASGEAEFQPSTGKFGTGRNAPRLKGVEQDECQSPAKMDFREGGAQERTEEPQGPAHLVHPSPHKPPQRLSDLVSPQLWEGEDRNVDGLTLRTPWFDPCEAPSSEAGRSRSLQRTPEESSGARIWSPGSGSGGLLVVEGKVKEVPGGGARPLLRGSVGFLPLSEVRLPGVDAQGRVVQGYEELDSNCSTADGLGGSEFSMPILGDDPGAGNEDEESDF
eukprot:g7748.t1